MMIVCHNCDSQVPVTANQKCDECNVKLWGYEYEDLPQGVRDELEGRAPSAAPEEFDGHSVEEAIELLSRDVSALKRIVELRDSGHSDVYILRQLWDGPPATSGGRPTKAEGGAANHRQGAWLILHPNQGGARREFELRSGRNVIGRAGSDIAVDIGIDGDEYVSREHAVLHVEGNGYFITDDEKNGTTGKASTNGTFVNGSPKRLSPGDRAPLRDGASIQIGRTLLIFKCNTSIETARTDVMKTGVIPIQSVGEGKS